MVDILHLMMVGVSSQRFDRRFNMVVRHVGWSLLVGLRNTPNSKCSGNKYTVEQIHVVHAIPVNQVTTSPSPRFRNFFFVAQMA